MKILIVDDDIDIRKIISIYLKGEEYEVVEASNGIEALELIDSNIDLIILDIMMPKLDGIATCAKIREQFTIPIIFLTAKVEEVDKISGLTLGGDDYITKPFSPMELVARVKSNLRRCQSYNKLFVDTQKDKSHIIEVDNIKIDTAAYIVYKNNTVIPLTKTEFGILKLLASNKGIVFNLVQIYENVWGEQSILHAENTVSVHIKKLREKIEDDIKNPQYIKTVWGVGYRVD